MLKNCFIIFILSFGAAGAAVQNNSDLNRLIEQNQFSSAESLIRQQLKTQQNRPDLQFQLARILSWQKKYETSLTEYDALLFKFPENGDYLLGKAQTLYWAGRNKEALLLLENSTEETVNNKDMWILQIKILQSSADELNHKKIKPLLKQAKKRFPDQQWDNLIIKKTKPSSDISYTEVEVGYNVERLNKGFDNWSSVYLSGEHQYINKRKIYAAVTQTDRFNINDEEYLLGFFTPINSKWNMVIETSYSPSHKVRPKRSVFTQVKRRLNYGWNGYIGWRQTDYNEADTRALSLGMERYWKNYRASYTLFSNQMIAIGILKKTYIVHSITGDYYYGVKNMIGMGITSGEELEYNGRPNPPVSDIFAVYFKGRHWLTSKWAISYVMAFHEQGIIYNRIGYRLGLRYHY